MMKHHVTLLMNTFVTHDVRRFVVTRPDGFGFTPGQGVELAIDTPEWREQARPFTPTSLDADGVVEFTIKGYPQHKGVTQALHHLRPGASLLMSEPFGTIKYHRGSAGAMPFLRASSRKTSIKPAISISFGQRVAQVSQAAQSQIAWL